MTALLSPTLAAYEWELEALCRRDDPELWFDTDPRSVREAKRICADCPVLAACRQASLDRREPFGTWGGLSEKERRKLTGRRRP